LYDDTALRGRRHSIHAPLSLIVLTASFAGLVAPAAAQVAAATQVAAPAPDAIKQREQELEAARAQQKSAAELQEKLKADIAAIGQDRSKLNQQLIDIAARVRGVEPGLATPKRGCVRSMRASSRFAPRSIRGAPNRRGAGRPATRRPPRTAGLAGAA